MRRRIEVLSSVVIALLLLPAVPAAERPPGIAPLLSAPFPTELTAAPAGGAVAWVFNDRGSRNIWVATPPDYRGRRLTNYVGDDGQDISALAWTPDGRAVVYVRGGDANRQGELPNPTSDPKGVEQAIWIIGLDGGDPRRIGDGDNPSVSPRGDRIAFTHRGRIWAATLGPGPQPGKPEPLIAGRGQMGSVRWSPDGSKLAFVSARGDHAFIGVYDVAARTLRYLDPGVDRDGNPVWSPDGRRVAFIRIPALRQAFAFGPRRAGEPWSIRIAEVSDGTGRELWRADAGPGSVFHGIVAENQLLWGAGDRIVFPWERDGWTHLYALPAAGGTPALLTPGAFEVEHVTLTPDRTAVVYSSNQEEAPGDIDRRHLWRVPVAGGRVEALTRGSGIEWAPVVTSDGAIAFLRSDAHTPAHPAILAGAGPARELAPGTLPADVAWRSLVVPEAVAFPAADGMTIRGQLFLPPNRAPGTRSPAVIFFHGGSRRQMLLGWHYLAYYHNAYAFNQYLASRGFVVLSVNYRSGTGYGLEFREAINYGATGASEFNDVLGAGLYLRGRPDVDPKRIGLWGGSYGGYLTALGLARASDLFAAGVDLHGVHEWNVVIRNFVETYDPRARPDAARTAFESSPMASISTWRSPVLLIHGDDDRNVPFSETVNLVEALRQQGVEHELLVFPDEVHGFLLHRRWIEAFERAADFLERKLKGRATSSH
ncbi:MAG TPA: prolyl oligopeptidase family serine peptidase [Vicinamibacterales bacterium]|nr:prolyl oligopeptidase family serine peptidase [Vicinamibacterales bacterium]